MTVDTKSADVKIPSTEELVGRAADLVPVLRERALKAEEDRRVPDETIEEIAAADLLKIMKPPRFGGYGLGLDVATEVTATLARGDGSSGWVGSLFIGHPWHTGLFGLEAQEDVWGDGGDPRIATASFSIRSDRQKVDGGWRLSGQWKFSSGSDFADWFIIMKPAPDSFDWMLIPASDVTVLDDWFVSGLCATGSRDIVLDDVFVPDHRRIAEEDIFGGTAPGVSVEGGVLNPGLPFFESIIFGIPAVIIGMAKGLTEVFADGLVGKRSMMGGQLQTERAANQIRLAEANANVDAAFAVMRARLAELNRWGIEGEPENPADRLALRRDAAWVSQLMVRTATSVAMGAGASAIYRKNPIQRFVRDIMAGATHVTVAWDDQAETYGRAAWGIPDPS